MATQNSKKSKKAASGKKTSARTATTGKTAQKAVKAKTAKKAVAKKAKPAPKAKKTAGAKTSPVKKAVKKTASKATAKKTTAVKATAKKAAAKKATVKKAVKKAAAPKLKVVKAGKAPKSGARTKSSKPAVKTVKPKVAAKPKVQVPPAKPKASPKPQVKKPVVKAKPVSKPMGSKVTDITQKPSVSTQKTTGTKSAPASKPFTPSRSVGGLRLKPFEKMSDKKEHKTVMTVTATEPQKTRYSDLELEEFDQLIDQKLIVAREQLEFYLKQLEDMAENPDNKIKGLDDGLSSLESERVSSLASRQQKLIQHLENAKIRIKNKVYGICRETGKLISKERLRAVPHATLSIEAKQAQN